MNDEQNNDCLADSCRWKGKWMIGTKVTWVGHGVALKCGDVKPWMKGRYEESSHQSSTYSLPPSLKISTDGFYDLAGEY